ncbi:hypothetical protein SAMN05216365_10535 [Porphyromonadaceae bacterium NLAE-zl-C104]|nr:hypothetical protein SAMN05216365_10535 [Porphyromonadaceae bacterium NLAE-zl-C104]
MSQSCPLCGKTKTEEALFCDDCTRKIHTEYEVDIPKEIEIGSASVAEDLRVQEHVEDKKEAGNHVKSEMTHVDKEPDVEPESGLEPDLKSEKTGVKKKKGIGIPLLFLLVITLLTGGFFVYNETIRKSNLDRSGWDAAVKANSVEGFLAYMEAHPRGAHFDEAQAGLHRLKSEEAAAWERMKETDNVTELRDFLDRHTDSPYTPLVRTRLDSLIWIGALQMNTPESYSDYIMLTENGGIKGDYIAEARKRYDLLSRAQSVDVAALDSIRATINGFFTALSALDHNGMVRYLAPTVYRFFNSGAATRERITGELLVTGAQTEGATLKFTPDIESVQYEVTSSNHYKVNVPLRKSYQKGGATEDVYGYIAHIELDTLFQIVSIFETKPYPEAP